MTLTRSFLATAALALGFLQGCSSASTEPAPFESQEEELSTPPRLVAEAVTVEQAFADEVVVEDNRLVVPSSTAGLGTITVGSIVAGNRSSLAIDAPENTNPLGFLRRVTKIEVVGGKTVLSTAHATLADWVEEGDIDFGANDLLGGGRPLAADGLSPQAKGKKGDTEREGSATAKLDSEESVSKVGMKGNFKITNANLKMNAKFSGHWKVKKKGFWKAKVPVGLDTGMLLTLDPTLAAQIEASVSAGAAADPSTAATLFEKEWKPFKNAIRIPLGALGGIPIVASFSPTLKCSVTAHGSARAVIGASVSSHAAAGVSVKAGLTDIDIEKTFEPPTMPKPTFTLIAGGDAEMKAECEVHVTVSITAFGGLMLTAEAGPKVSVTARACAALDPNARAVNTDFSLFEQHSFRAELGGRVEVPFIHIGKDFDIKNIETGDSPPFYLVGDGKGCDPKKEEPRAPTEDSCEGRRDGFYCSTLSPYAGFHCVGESISHGMQCAITEKCIGGDAETIQCR